jgi:pantoate--beta-alanine ligase
LWSCRFGPKEDLAKYPRTLEADRELCEKVGASAIFHPEPKTMYPEGFHTFVEVEKLDATLCGPRRSGHFRGVCTVVLKLLNIVTPDVAVFGAKDYQQAAILKRMVRDLDLPVRMHIAATVREADGLAMSSRNRYLSPEERSLAPRLFQALQFVQDLANRGERNVATLEKALAEKIALIPGTRIDYASIVDAEDLQSVELLTRPAVAAFAVFLGTTRLIDNLVIL